MRKIKFLICLIAVFITVGCTGKDTNIMINTTWTDADGSELVFETDRIYWYKDKGIHNDNYYAGVYKFYRGEEAVKYISTELSEYGVTEDELSDLFDHSSYDKNDFVVFDLRYDTYILNGKQQEITKPLVPWYGFILDDDTKLEVVNMNTVGKYRFTKETD